MKHTSVGEACVPGCFFSFDSKAHALNHCAIYPSEKYTGFLVLLIINDKPLGKRLSCYKPELRYLQNEIMIPMVIL